MEICTMIILKKREELPPEIERSKEIKLNGNKYNLVNPII